MSERRKGEPTGQSNDMVRQVPVSILAPEGLLRQVLEGVITMGLQEKAEQRIVDTAARVTQYIQDERVQNLVILDRAARPFHIVLNTYWKLTQDDKDLPYDVFFLNPRGLTSDRSSSYLLHEVVKSRHTQDTLQGILLPRRQEDVYGDMQSSPPIVNAIDKTTLIYDNCAHTGETIMNARAALEDVGFTDIRVATASTHGSHGTQGSSLVDFVALPDETYPTCYMFGLDTTIKKPFNTIYSHRNSSSDEQAHGINLKRELTQLVKRRLK